MLLLFIACFQQASAQSYSVKSIHQKVDSVIRTNIGDSIPIEYRMWVGLISYQYQKKESGRVKKKKWKTREVSDTTKGIFRGAELSYHIYFKDKHNVGWERFGLPIDTICVDADFNLITPLKARRIPEYILNGDTTKFLDYLQACRLIKEQFPVDRNMEELKAHYLKRTGVMYLKMFKKPKVSYDCDLLFERNTMRYHWHVLQIIRCGTVAGYIESIEEEYKKKYGHLYETKDLKRIFYLDAMTGEIMYQGDFEPCAADSY